ncbi:MAG TPA: AAA family ATPase [Pirellulaceae bacterium]|nr:AAA family ATPase [Pirellulaceae bacterium]
MPGNDPLAALREALALSPDNVPLRQHLAESLLGSGQPEQAEAEFKAALALAPESTGLKIGLARAFLAQQKASAALVILEAMVQRRDAPGLAHVLLARLQFGRGEVPQAVAQYKLGVEKDPAAADLAFAGQLGIDSTAEDSEVVDGRMRAAWDEPGGAATEIERPKINFESVGGMEALKEEIRLKIIHPLNHPELYKAYGKAIGGGMLMYGPPGCGKTHLARATAGEIKAAFIAVGINDVLDMWIGNSERNLHALFEQARENKPCVLFFDEADALGAKRSDMHHAGNRHLINQFLAEMDGIQSSNEGLLILAATNSPWHLDPAFRRPGRFDRVLFVPPPDAAARASILRILVKGKPVQDLDLNLLAKKTDQFSGADLKAVVDLAIEGKLREALKAGVPKPLTTADLLGAAAQLKPTTKEWFATARNHALYSNQGGVYDDILKYLKLT